MGGGDHRLQQRRRGPRRAGGTRPPATRFPARPASPPTTASDTLDASCGEPSTPFGGRTGQTLPAGSDGLSGEIFEPDLAPIPDARLGLMLQSWRERLTFRKEASGVRWQQQVLQSTIRRPRRPAAGTTLAAPRAAIALVRGAGRLPPRLDRHRPVQRRAQHAAAHRPGLHARSLRPGHSRAAASRPWSASASWRRSCSASRACSTLSAAASLVRIAGSIDETLSERVYDIAAKLPLKALTPPGYQPLHDLDRIRSFMSTVGPAALFDLPWMPLYLAICFLFHPLIGITATVGGADPRSTITVADRIPEPPAGARGLRPGGQPDGAGRSQSPQRRGRAGHGHGAAGWPRVWSDYNRRHLAGAAARRRHHRRHGRAFARPAHGAAVGGARASAPISWSTSRPRPASSSRARS